MIRSHFTSCAMIAWNTYSFPEYVPPFLSFLRSVWGSPLRICVATGFFCACVARARPWAVLAAPQFVVVPKPNGAATLIPPLLASASASASSGAAHVSTIGPCGGTLASPFQELPGPPCGLSPWVDRTWLGARARR